MPSRLSPIGTSGTGGQRARLSRVPHPRPCSPRRVAYVDLGPMDQAFIPANDAPRNPGISTVCSVDASGSARALPLAYRRCPVRVLAPYPVLTKSRRADILGMSAGHVEGRPSGGALDVSRAIWPGWLRVDAWSTLGSGSSTQRTWRCLPFARWSARLSSCSGGAACVVGGSVPLERGWYTDRWRCNGTAIHPGAMGDHRAS